VPLHLQAAHSAYLPWWRDMLRWSRVKPESESTMGSVGIVDSVFDFSAINQWMFKFQDCNMQPHGSFTVFSVSYHINCSAVLSASNCVLMEFILKHDPQSSLRGGQVRHSMITSQVDLGRILQRSERCKRKQFEMKRVTQ
jgi:hypothetical protein